MAQTMHFVSLLFPHVTQLDLTGPVEVFSRLPGAVSHLAWHRLEPVETDSSFSILPTVSFADAPQADVLMVPGGQGAFELMEDPVAIEFVRRQAENARYVTSVCTGAFVLGAAGLLQGRRATTHWASHPMLELLGAVPTRGRVVRDGNIVTGGGVTSGIDFALTVAAEVYDAATARSVQLEMEYDPQPPFAAGSPDGADADPAYVESLLSWAKESREPIVRRVADGLTR
jgi:cyclohexyl-isocyanide hydratase